MRLYKFAACFALFVGACLQAHSQTKIRVNIPFDFTVGNHTLPAGKYDVGPALTGTAASWLITNHQGSGTFLMTNAVSSPIADHKCSLLFRRFRGQYALVQFWTGRNNGRDVVRPKIAPSVIAQSELVQIAAER